MFALAASALLAGCASGPRGGVGRDGAEANPPANLASIPDAEPRVEAIRSSGGTSMPYTVLGRSYTPVTDDQPLREAGLASWYGRKFHSQSTASGEPYDMYAMTAAHKTLPLPSYVQVRNPANGREVIVRVNDRGPFVDGRVIDLSYTAALKLDLLRGVAPVEIERITNEDIRTGAWRQRSPTQFAATSPVAPPPSPSVLVPSAWIVPVASPPSPSPSPSSPSQSPSPSPSASGDAPRDMVVADLPRLPALTGAPPRARLETSSEAPAAPALSGAPAGAPLSGFWVQLGAFRERNGAERLLAQTTRELPSLAGQLQVFSEGGTHRVQCGPYASREAAAEAVGRVQQGLRISALVLKRP